MADIKIAVDRTQQTVVVSALPGTDVATYELAKPRIQQVLEAIGMAVQFTPLTEIEQHSHGEQTLVVEHTHIRH